jgi:membrane protein
MGILIRSVRDYFKDDGVIFSASLSFFTMTAIVPLCLFLVTSFGYVLGEDREFFGFFTEKLIGLFPEITAGITSELRKLITFKGIGKMSLVLFAFLSFQLYSAIHKALESVFKVREKRTLTGAVLLPLAVVTVLVALMFLSFTLTSAVPFMRVYKQYLPWLEIGAITGALVRFVLPLLLVQFAAITVYIIVPNTKVRFFDAFWGGLFTALMLEASKHLFTWYVGSVARLGTIYGSLTAFVVFMLWVFYSSSIFLIGGEIVNNLGGGPHIPSRRASDMQGRNDEGGR